MRAHRPSPTPWNQRGAASVEHAGLALLIALVCAGAVAAVAARPPSAGAPELARAIAQKLRCAPRLPGHCWRDPLTTAYGRPLAGLVRALAPAPRALTAPGTAGLLPVDYRLCRSSSCAAPGERPELTASNRRVSTFVSVVDDRRASGTVAVTYWEYRPILGWRRVARTASAVDVTAHAMTPLPESANPRLIPLETVPGRNHAVFPASEEPPWRWRIASVVP